MIWNTIASKRRMIMENSERKGNSQDSDIAFTFAIAMTLLTWTLAGLAIVLAIYAWSLARQRTAQAHVRRGL